jgi:amino acid adenylation domain-containing protein
MYAPTDPWARCSGADREVLAAMSGPVEPVEADELVRALARRYAAGGDRTALVDRDREWSWGELADRVWAIRAGLLDPTGLGGPGDPAGLGGPAGPRVGTVFGVAIDRCAELVATVHAVALAGAAYCPIGPADPPAWQRSIARASGAAAVLVAGGGDTAGGGADPADGAGPARLDVRSFRAAGPAPAPRLSGSDTAQVVFTSGSTGRPKGVVCTHAGFTNRIRWAQRALPLTAADRVALKTPTTFDVAGWELFWPAYAGAGTVVVPPGAHASPEALTAVFTRHAVTVAHFVPSMLRLWLRAGGAGRCPDLRLVICSGEALTADLVEEFHRQSPARLHNMYGPTEAAIDVTHAPARPGQDPVPIGRPITNTAIRVLAADGSVCPVGETGEICVQGVGVAAGYLGAGEADRRRFAPLPGLPAPEGWRTFRTGDLGRVDAEGQLEFRGRVDDQVKIRGQRVELAEVEAALRQHELVADACAAAYPAGSGRLCLAAYAVLAPGAAAADPVGALAGHLQRTLPSRSVPARIVVLDELPLGAHGKVDRARLPRPGRARPDLARPYEPPATELERRIAAVWAHVLDLDEVGRHDDFHDLGGDSLAAVEVWFLLAERLGLDHDSDLLAAVVLTGDTVAAAARLAGGGPGD